MQAVILAGGLGSRISEETHLKPKPMIEIGGNPILWHILKIYSYYGVNEFIICCGYKGYLIKEYFANYILHNNSVTIDLNNNSMQVYNKKNEPWKVTLVDTGESTMTGGRLKRVKDYISEKRFFLTYGDGVADINISHLLEGHINSGKMGNVTAVQTKGRFGSLEINDQNIVSKFIEKPIGDGGWINGGFFVFEKEFIDLIDNDQTILELDPLEKITEMHKLNSFKHNGFWQPMDTLRDKVYLENLWNNDNCPWKIW